MPPRAESKAIPAIEWTTELTWLLVGEMEVSHNAKVLFGKKEKNENTSRERKTAVHKAIALKIFPDLSALNAKVMGDRVRGKIEQLRKKYVKLAKRLKATGEGLKDDNHDDSGDDGEAKEIYMRFYIAPDGPDHDTSGEARNIWDAPRGREILYLQDPNAGITPEAHGSTADLPDIPIDPRLLNMPEPVTSSAGRLSPAPLSRASSFDIPSTPVLVHSFGTEMVNTTPAATTSSTSDSTASLASPSIMSTPSKRAPKPSHLSDEALSKAKASIQVVPRKRSLEEQIFDIQKQQIAQLAKDAQADRVFKKRKLLLKELELGIWDATSYKEEIAKLEALEDDS
ncbi:hypothetical protein EYR36_004063 [Pleurotus pulmonarius]|nr:hypothetical protein EYR36_004063 [Pleurotus pulmonarius]KAF4581616.1 hypothetical protein EYR38_002945 [Pleurotus pulmonarius]